MFFPNGPGLSLMFDQLRTIIARFITRYRRRPRPLLTRAWFSLAAQADSLEEKRRCLKAVLQLDPDNEPASVALLLLDQERPTS